MTNTALFQKLIAQKKLEAVVPKLECFRAPHRYKLAEGGRGAARSWSITSLLIQIANYQTKKILCCREIQKSIDESVYDLLRKMIGRLGYQNWEFKNNEIRNTVTDSRFIFNGLKDLRAASSLKSIEDVDICWIEEAHGVSKESLDVLIPTIRKDGSEIWASWNATSAHDPISDLINRDDACHVFLTYRDNPYFPPILEAERLYDLENRPDEYEHIWEGHPRSQGDRAIFSREVIRQAMSREIADDGAEEIGADIARYGDDRTVFVKRKGLKCINKKVLRKADNLEVARELWIFANRDKNIMIKIDEGYGVGVIDILREYGAKVCPIQFGSDAYQSDKFGNLISEMWFTFPMNEAQIFDDNDLMIELAGRQYKFDNKARRTIESKDEYKKRNGGKSPDYADALLLAFFVGANHEFDKDLVEQMKARRLNR